MKEEIIFTDYSESTIGKILNFCEQEIGQDFESQFRFRDYCDSVREYGFLILSSNDKIYIGDKLIKENGNIRITRKPKKVFLGGTCSDSKWRDKFIPMLDKGKIKYFNPVTHNGDDKARKREIYEREHDDYVLYVLSRAYSTYSIAEVVDDSNKRPEKTICCVLNEEVIYKDLFKKIVKKSLNKQELKHLNQVGKLCERNGAKYFTSLEEVANYLNNNN